MAIKYINYAQYTVKSLLSEFYLYMETMFKLFQWTNWGFLSEGKGWRGERPKWQYKQEGIIEVKKFLWCAVEWNGMKKKIIINDSLSLRCPKESGDMKYIVEYDIPKEVGEPSIPHNTWFLSPSNAVYLLFPSLLLTLSCVSSKC